MLITKGQVSGPPNHSSKIFKDRRKDKIFGKGSSEWIRAVSQAASSLEYLKRNCGVRLLASIKIFHFELTVGTSTRPCRIEQISHQLYAIADGSPPVGFLK